MCSEEHQSSAAVPVGKGSDTRLAVVVLPHHHVEYVDTGVEQRQCVASRQVPDTEDIHLVGNSEQVIRFSADKRRCLADDEVS